MSSPNFTFPLDEQQLEKYIEGANDIHRSEIMIYKAVDDSGTAVGHISIGRIKRDNRSGRVGRVLVSPLARGKGIGTEMMNNILRVGFEELQLHRINLGVFDFNHSAVQCYRKAGFKEEGLQRDTIKYRDQYWSVFEMSILEDEWRNIR
ncbi:GNAT family protein [Paenibacillus sp.]|jgi:RimJ/RimL family protein N-acetyltransferase|uniref:GNAT family N-acetyltransferase n=1 Tax=Paenibacillus sp. TaxID=58172 RepID=UPI00283A902D|nr:GNAT family protein [Paenibacillus sp.]